MMDIRIFIGMPLRYAKSVLQDKNIPYVIKHTVSRSHFFQCDTSEIYIIRAQMRENVAHLLVNYTLQKSDSVKQILQVGEKV
jgi:hypothetical protein